ncbi:uncharacterized protein LAESUDRAFT_814287 [Laetiporus sulphureus 93-53]|uniref:Uncharacterized protein n=1 Tax=Laetiporus sulphureus 93-53 TaxID=1314785 RepID=A0A165D2L2_9APHY|nr:uncharacterized protein LAESUDRAFT_814287 [Laetiporus sulphureus 93-53]KZT04033.1 hypothetical protein LAESUDRAFT_814287 [Laetiporus sulphureus 93-53]
MPSINLDGLDNRVIRALREFVAHLRNSRRDVQIVAVNALDNIFALLNPLQLSVESDGDDSGGSEHGADNDAVDLLHATNATVARLMYGASNRENAPAAAEQHSEHRGSTHSSQSSHSYPIGDFADGFNVAEPSSIVPYAAASGESRQLSSRAPSPPPVASTSRTSLVPQLTQRSDWLSGRASQPQLQSPVPLRHTHNPFRSSRPGIFYEEQYHPIALRENRSVSAMNPSHPLLISFSDYADSVARPGSQPYHAISLTGAFNEVPSNVPWLAPPLLDARRPLSAPTGVVNSEQGNRLYQERLADSDDAPSFPTLAVEPAGRTTAESQATAIKQEEAEVDELDSSDEERAVASPDENAVNNPEAALPTGSSRSDWVTVTPTRQWRTQVDWNNGIGAGDHTESGDETSSPSAESDSPGGDILPQFPLTQNRRNERSQGPSPSPRIRTRPPPRLAHLLELTGSSSIASSDAPVAGPGPSTLASRDTRSLRSSHMESILSLDRSPTRPQTFSAIELPSPVSHNHYADHQLLSPLPVPLPATPAHFPPASLSLVSPAGHDALLPAPHQALPHIPLAVDPPSLRGSPSSLHEPLRSQVEASSVADAALASGLSHSPLVLPPLPSTDMDPAAEPFTLHQPLFPIGLSNRSLLNPSPAANVSDASGTIAGTSANEDVVRNEHGAVEPVAGSSSQPMRRVLRPRGTKRPRDDRDDEENQPEEPVAGSSTDIRQKKPAPRSRKRSRNDTDESGATSEAKSKKGKGKAPAKPRRR